MPTRVFCFHISILTDNTPGSGGKDCAGCETPAFIRWYQAIIYDNSTPGNIACLLDYATPGSTDWIRINGAIPVAAKETSWGQLKSLYR
jgi:hypothetical protein